MVLDLRHHDARDLHLRTEGILEVSAVPNDNGPAASMAAGLRVAKLLLRADDSPGQAGDRARIRELGARQRRPVHEPEHDPARAALVAPHDVRLAVVVEVTDALDLPVQV